MNELDKLEEILTEKGIAYKRIDRSGFLYKGKMINQFHKIDVNNEKYSWDVICHPGSYGYEAGLLEYWDNIEANVIGFLTAEDVIKLIDTSEYRRGFNDALSQIYSAIENVKKER